MLKKPNLQSYYLSGHVLEIRNRHRRLAVKPASRLAGIYYQGLPGFSYLWFVRMTVNNQVVVAAIGERLRDMMLMYQDYLLAV